MQVQGGQIYQGDCKLHPWIQADHKGNKGKKKPPTIKLKSQNLSTNSSKIIQEGDETPHLATNTHNFKKKNKKNNTVKTTL